jgi:hypothetical protein
VKLQEALDRVRQLSDDDVIFARPPWKLDADADIGPLDTDYRVPAAITQRGLAYFLEASVANEVLQVFGDREPTADECRRLLMFYAEHDAYPDWVFES